MFHRAGNKQEMLGENGASVSEQTESTRTSSQENIEGQAV